MTKRTKYVLGGIGIIGIGVIIFPTIESNLRSFFNPLRGSTEGELRTRRETERNDYKLKLGAGKHTSQLDLEIDSHSLQEVTLDVERGQGGLLATTPFLSDSPDQDHPSSVRNILGEILKETKTKNLETKMDSKYEELVKRYLGQDEKSRQSILEAFKKAEASIKRWLETVNKPNYKAPEKGLSKEERISLQKLYEFFKDLSGEGRGFSDELGEVSGETTGDTTQKPASTTPSLTAVKKSLKIIGWDKNKINVRPNNSTRFFKASDWGEWNKNPYKTFYESEGEFQKHLDNMNGSSSAITKLQQGISRGRSMWGGMGRAESSFQAQEKQIQALQANQASEIEHHVGSKLLSFMNR